MQSADIADWTFEKTSWTHQAPPSSTLRFHLNAYILSLSGSEREGETPASSVYLKKSFTSMSCFLSGQCGGDRTTQSGAPK